MPNSTPPNLMEENSTNHNHNDEKGKEETRNRNLVTQPAKKIRSMQRMVADLAAEQINFPLAI